ncbi:TetR/AcrR family transcriptional regulator [Nocardia miyunensis]|uniref:TetR/AcrR family transcriptional regulator n=1 Tax=Nocardia miyunensis TaxID=282684 RepID=UPI000829F750|nr:TetR/AcrR family transcriptional regulator C-terminal domain-containing protein [Nocardia miyunensis]
MPRPRSLTTDDLATAALAVIDRAGLPALTMRAVAQELRMATMALYRYVSDRDELEILVANRILDPVDVSLPPDADWRERVETLLDRLRAAASAHPAAIPLTLRHRQSAPASLRWIEAMLTVLTEAGFTGSERVIAQRTIVGFLLGYLQNAHYASLIGPGTARLAQAPAEEFPLLAETAAQASTMSPDDEFRGGTALLLEGLTARLEQR